MILLSCLSCAREEPKKENRFDREKWQLKEGRNYPYRFHMIKDVVYNDTIRSLTREELLKLLGDPDREEKNHLYYMISQERIGSWPLHTRSMVVKLKENDSIEWIKIHE